VVNFLTTILQMRGPGLEMLRVPLFVWCVGVLLLLLSVLTAFVGYVLPWGQMSFYSEMPQK